MFPNNGSTTLLVTNSTGANIDVNILAVPDEAGRTGTSAASLPLNNPSNSYEAVISDGLSVAFGPFRQSWWNQVSGNIGYVYVDFIAANNKIYCSLITAY